MYSFEQSEYWAYYLNRATSNLFAILNQVAGRLEIAPQAPDASLHKHPVLTSPLAPDGKRLRWLLLSRYLPFLKTFEYENPRLARLKTPRERAVERRRGGRMGNSKTLNEKVQLRSKELDYELPEAFQTLLAFLGHARNYFTHYYFAGDAGQAKKHCYSKFRRALDFEAVVRPIWNKGILMSVARFEYKIKRYSWLIVGLNSKYHHTFIQNGQLTVKGLAYFTSLFLEWGEAYQFLSRFYGFSTQDADPVIAERKQVTFITYTAHCCKPPKPVLEVADHRPRVQLLTQLLEELSKCPAVLFDRLEKNRQEELAYAIRHDRLGNTEVNLADQQERVADGAIQTKVYPIRKQLRFGYFVLHFIEQMNLFKGLRFHIELGKVILKHEFESGYTHKWFKEVRTFGRLAYFEKLKQEAEAEVPAAAAVVADYEFFSPHYHLTNDSIYFVFDQRSDEATRPKIVRRGPDDKGFSETALEQLPHPQVYRMHIYDFMVLVFLKLQDSDFDLKSYVENLAAKYRQFLGAVATGAFKAATKAEFTEKLQAYNLKPSDVPQDVKWSLQNYQLDYTARIEQLLLKAHKQTQKRLDNLRRAAPNIGKMAAYLAEDIIKQMLPKSDFKAEFSADDYQTLQAGLCCLRLEKVSIKEQLQKLITLKSKSLGHPFLHMIIPLLDDNRTTLKEFYEQYLRARIYFLNGLRISKPPRFERLEQYPFLNLPYESQNGKKVPKTYDSEFLKRYYEKYSEEQRPFILPRGLFNALVDRHLGIKNEKPNNFIYSMLQRTADQQNFYGFKRKVRFNMSKAGLEVGSPSELWHAHQIWKNKWKNHQRKDKVNYEKEKNAWHKYFADDKKIRLLQVQDQVLLELAKYLAQRLEQNLKIDTRTWTLERLRYRTESAQHAKNLLDETIEVGFQVGKTLVKTKTALKKYGSVNIFLRTKRVQELLPKLQETELGLEALENCIAALDKYGYKEAFKHIQGLEQACHDMGFESEDNFTKHTVYLDFLRKKGLLDKATEDQLKRFRNSFCHSGFNFEGQFELAKVLDEVKAIGLKYDTVSGVKAL